MDAAMKHVFIGETRRFMGRHIEDMDGFFFDLCADSSRGSMTYFIRCKWSGRNDTIRCVTTDHELHGHRYDGQLLLLEDNNYTYGLYMYAIHNRRPISRGGEVADEESSLWHWATSDTMPLKSDDRDVFKVCLASIKNGNKTK